MLSRDFKEFVGLLNANAVEYLVVSGYALAAHGFARRQVVHFGGLDLPIIPVEDFRTNKRAVGRLRDLADLEALDGKPDD